MTMAQVMSLVQSKSPLTDELVFEGLSVPRWLRLCFKAAAGLQEGGEGVRMLDQPPSPLRPNRNMLGKKYYRLKLLG